MDLRDRHGQSPFGQGCLLARRLVEAGVAFVEVYLQNWDTHVKKTADDARIPMTQVDEGASALVSDLKERGLLRNHLRKGDQRKVLTRRSLRYQIKPQASWIKPK